jgi:hypothetical protein
MFHSCTSAAGSEQTYFSERTLQLGKMYSLARHQRQKQAEVKIYSVCLDIENQSAYLSAYQVANRNVC